MICHELPVCRVNIPVLVDGGQTSLGFFDRGAVCLIHVAQVLQGVRGFQAAQGLFRFGDLAPGGSRLFGQGIKALSAVFQRLLHGQGGAGQGLHDGFRPRLFFGGKFGLGRQGFQFRNQRINRIPIA